ncbi:MAG: periplasmic heavy metal sensor [Deltaproteobacteria bacterium]|nr:periplasmic heavy metal sensor [Deltaproteobacteria bacterium]
MGRRFWIGSAVFGLLGLMVVTASACGRHHGPGPHGMLHGDEEIDLDHLRHGARWMLRSADPSDQQLDEIAIIAKEAIEQMRGLHEGHEAHRAEFAAALSGQAVDRDALERLRGEVLMRMEEGSKQVVDTLVQVAEVLTPEQRATLIAEHEKHRGRHGGRGHGWR